MNVQLQLRMPETDLTAIDELSKGKSRSEYIRKVIDEYTLSKSKMLEMLEDQLKELSDNDYNNAK